MTSMRSPAGALAATLRSERAGIQALVELLTEERQLLSRQQTDALAELAPRKRELLLHIAHLGEHRNRLIAGAGVSADRRGMHALLASLPETHETRTEWRLLLEITQRAHRLNQENGAFIDAGMRATQQALSVLVSAASAGTYGPGGRTLNPLFPRSLASA